MKKFISLLISIFLCSTFTYSQTCDCYNINADSTLPRVPMTQGLDSGFAPLYHCNNCSSQAIVLPFSFCFYGQSYDTVYVNNKGNLTFNRPDFTFRPNGLPFGNDTLMLAAFYADVDDSPRVVLQQVYADVCYSLTPTHLMVQWGTVGWNVPDCDFFDNFEVTITNGSDTILPPGNNVSFCYYIMNWADGDSNSIGFGGTLSKIGVNKGDGVHYAQFGTFRNRGYSYYGPYDTNSQLYWTWGKSFIFNTCVTGNNIPPVLINPNLCYYDTVCAGDTLSFPVSFLCSEPGQKLILSDTLYGLSGFTGDTSSANSIYTDSCRIIPALKDTGDRYIKITATDNGSPALTNSLSIHIFIKNCHNGLGIPQISNDHSSFTIYPNPNNGKFDIVVSPNGSLWDRQGSVDSENKIEVYNLLGEEVFQSNIQNSKSNIDLSSQPCGIYFLKYYNGSMLEGVKKLVIQK